MRVMLSNTPLGKAKNLKLTKDMRTLRPSTGILYLGSMLGNQKALGLSRIADVILEEPNVQGTRQRISRFGPDVFGVTLYEFNVSEVRDLIAEVKSQNPGTLCFVGGPAATEVPRYALHTTGADAVFRGEADLTFRRVMERLDKGEKLTEIEEEGLLVRNGHKIKESAESLKRPIVPADVYKAIVPDIGLLHELNSFAEYWGIDFSFSRGCTYQRCSFCQVSVAKRFRKLPHEKTLQILREISQIPGNNGMVFGDATFGSGKAGAVKILRDIMKERIAFPMLFAEVSMETLLEAGEIGSRKADMEVLKLMKDSGMEAFEIGIESLSEHQLMKFNKPRFTFDEIKAVYGGMKITELYGGGGIHLTGFDSVAEDVIECIERIFTLRRMFGEDIFLNVSDSVIPFAGTAEYGKFMKFTNFMSNSMSFLLSGILLELNAVEDIRDYGDEYPFLFKTCLPIADSLLMQATLPDPAMSQAISQIPDPTDHLIESDTFAVLDLLRKIENNLGAEPRERANALDAAIRSAKSEAGRTRQGVVIGLLIDILTTPDFCM